MNDYLVGFGCAAVLSAVLTVLLVPFAKQRGIFLPAVRARDQHQQPTPRVGGIAVLASFLLVLASFWLFVPESLHFSAQRYFGLDANLLGFVLAVILLGIVNISDDYKGVPWWLRLVVEIAAAGLVIGFGIKLPWLSSPVGGRIMLGSLGSVLAVIWLVGLSNVVNWLDGVDGLAGGVSAIALIVLFILSIGPKVSQHSNALLAIIALGAVVGFLPFNVVNAKAFLGDTGSVFLGFVIGVLSIISGGKIATAFLVLAIPLLDAIVVIWGRITHRQSPFKPDRSHLHHKLLEMGLKPWQIVGVYYLFTAAFGLIALNTQTIGKLQAAVLAVALMIVLAVIYSYRRRPLAE